MRKKKSVGELYIGNENLKGISFPKVNKMTKGGSITIPSSIRRELGINYQDKFEVRTDSATGDIILKRIIGIDALSPINENLFNFNGRLLSIQSAIEVASVVAEIRECINKELGREIAVEEIAEQFSRLWADGDTFITNPTFNKSAYLRSIETRTNEIKDAIERKDEDAKAISKKAKQKEKELLTKKLEKEFKKEHILKRITEEEANKYLKKVEYNKLKKELEKEGK